MSRWQVSLMKPSKGLLLLGKDGQTQDYFVMQVILPCLREKLFVRRRLQWDRITANEQILY